MQPEQLRLGIDVGTADTVSVLVWPDGRWLRLLFDGASRLSSAVYVEPGGRLRCGQSAWQLAAADPRRLVPAPLAVRGDRLAVDGDDVASVDLVAAVLRRVGEEAAGVAGGPVTDVRLVVPAAWGPRRRTWLRQAAHRAGLGQPRLVEAPVAAAEQLLAGGQQVLVGGFLLVCDVGGGCEASVLRRGPGGFEVLSTLSDPGAGGTGFDGALLEALAGMDPGVAAAAADHGRWPLTASVRAAREALSQQTAVAVALPPPSPPLVVNAALVEQVGGPVLDRVAALAAEALAAAEVTAEQLAGVWCIGGTAGMPAVAQVVSEAVGRPAVVVADPAWAAVSGAAQAAATPAGPGPPPPVTVEVAPVRRAAATLIPVAMSLALVAQFLFTVQYGGGSRILRGPGFYVLANWGELAMAGLFVMVACLAAGTVLAWALAAADPAGAPAASTVRAGTGVLAAAALGAAVAGLYAVMGSLYFGLPVGPFLRWALLPLLPVGLVAGVVAVVAARGRRVPPSGWHTFLAFPPTSVLSAGAGMLLLQHSLTADRWPAMLLYLDLATRVGGLLIGVGAALALVRPLVSRLIAAAPLGVFCAAIAGWGSTGVLAVIYAVAVTAWWAQQLWVLVRSPVREPPGG